ncbi:MAG: sensor histidine kinase, partial [Nocardioidaceae bacterium]|nr:sensor histidine kinase [Nocardioidaceae bacterium]
MDDAAARDGSYSWLLMSNAAPDRPAGVRGILAGVDRLETWLHVAFVALTVTSAVRYVQGHGLTDRGWAVLGGAAALLVLYAVRPWVPWRRARWWPPLWCALLVLTWVVLALIAPSFSWLAVPLAFVALQVLPFPVAVVVLTLMVVTVVTAWTRMRDVLDPTVVIGPVSVAVLAVLAYRALERDAAERQRLLDDLREAQGDLADAQHRAGAIAERARLSREIHDSVAQDLSSINLLLQAAEQDWDTRSDAARTHVGQAARTSRHSLDEVRRVVRDLAPAELEGRDADLAEALERAGRSAVGHRPVELQVQVHGEPVPVSEPVAAALLRT